MSRNHDETPEDRMASALELIAETLEDGVKAFFEVGMAHVLLQACSVKLQARTIDAPEDLIKSACEHVDAVIADFLKTDDDDDEPTNAEES